MDTAMVDLICNVDSLLQFGYLYPFHFLDSLLQFFPSAMSLLSGPMHHYGFHIYTSHASFLPIWFAGFACSGRSDSIQSCWEDIYSVEKVDTSDHALYWATMD